MERALNRMLADAERAEHEQRKNCLVCAHLQTRDGCERLICAHPQHKLSIKLETWNPRSFMQAVNRAAKCAHYRDMRPGHDQNV